MLPEEYDEAIQEISRLYNIAEIDLKELSRETNEIFAAGINQCRYAGQHLVRALAATDDEIIREELGAAKRHAKRAVYDVKDAAIHFYLTEISDFRKRYPVPLKTIVPDYHIVIEGVRKAKRHIERKSHENSTSREVLYEDLGEDISVLRDAYEILLASEEDCIAQLKEQNLTKQRTWALIASSSIALLALVATLIFA